MDLKKEFKKLIEAAYAGWQLKFVKQYPNVYYMFNIIKWNIKKKRKKYKLFFLLRLNYHTREIDSKN